MPNATGPIRSIVVDFDGTICAADVSDEVLRRYVGPLARELDLEYERGEIGSRHNLVRTGELVTTPEADVLEWALSTFDVEPSFPPFAAWAREEGFDVTIVSDGIGIHIEPLLLRAGVEGLRILTNRLVLDGGGRPGSFDFPAGHPVCRECGTCKMLAVTTIREQGPVAYVGDGHSDRYGALYSDLVFAKGALADLCRLEGVAFVPWSSFDDVRVVLGDRPGPGSPPSPERCPGWREG